MSRSRAHALFAVFTVALLCCTSWGPPFGTSHLVPGNVPDRLRLSLANGRRLEILGPSVRGDTLFGDTLGPARLFFGPRRIAVGVPFRDIDSVSPRRIDGPMTVLAVAAATGGVIAVIKGAEAVQRSLQESRKQSCNIGKIDG
jgi:hypothetical protein